MAGPEKNYETKIRKLLDELGAYHVKYFGCGFSQAGVPDILCCLRGNFVAIEVKAQHGKPSELQLHNLRQIEQAGGFAILTYPSDWDDLALLLRLIEGFSPWDDQYEKFHERLTID